MACLKCGYPTYSDGKGNLVCSSCGRLEKVKMVDPADFIEKCELDLWDIVNKMRRSKVRCEIIYGILLEMTKTLEMQGYVEGWLSENLTKD